MRVTELDLFFRSILDLDRFAAADPSVNGLQVTNDGSDIKRVAFAVDACQETIERAVTAGAGMLFVHHGLFWGESLPLTGTHYQRIKTLISANMALYAAHLPLDAHAELGNNAGLSARLGLLELEPFGEWHGVEIGFIGQMAVPETLDSVLARLFPDGKKARNILPFGPKLIQRVAIISGGASDETEQAIAKGCDLYITGEIGHEVYHLALENRISVIAAGHYQSETVGVNLMAARLGAQTGIDTVFIDVPTGL